MNPTINWDALEHRCIKRLPIVLKLVEGESSFYWQRYENVVKNCEAARPLKATNFVVPGYYSMKDYEMITRVVTTRFAGEFRRRGNDGFAIRVREPVSFIEYVVMSEIVVSLIQEDM